MRLYLDTSALVKLVQVEEQSVALRDHLRQRSMPMVSSALARVELVRAVSGGGATAVAAARRLLDALELLAVDDAVLDAAGVLAPGSTLRSLDAVHLATALLAAPVEAVVTYDVRMARAAEALLLPAVAPA